MKKLEKYKIVPQAKFIKFKVKHFVQIPTICHDKAVPLSSCPPAWLMTQKSFPPTDPKGGEEDAMGYVQAGVACSWLLSYSNAQC